MKFVKNIDKHRNICFKCPIIMEEMKQQKIKNNEEYFGKAFSKNSLFLTICTECPYYLEHMLLNE